MSLSFRIAAVLCGLAAVAAVQASSVYKWTDDKGVVQYTDAPPEGRTFERLDVGRSGARAEVQSDEVDTESEAEPTPARRRMDAMRANCDAARLNLETLRNAATVTIDQDGDGIVETLDQAGREAAIARTEETVRQNCVEA